jgi:hypothetical protein
LQKIETTSPVYLFKTKNKLLKLSEFKVQHTNMASIQCCGTIHKSKISCTNQGKYQDEHSKWYCGKHLKKENRRDVVVEAKHDKPKAIPKTKTTKTTKTTLTTCVCNVTTKKGNPCTRKGKITFGDKTYCSSHDPHKIHKPKNCKNSLRNRISSNNHSTAISVLQSIADRIPTANTLTAYHQDNTCFYCDCDLTNEKIALDHILPVIANKKPNTKYIIDDNNIVQCCVPCNSSKGNKDVLTWMKDNQNEHINTPMKIQDVFQFIADIPDIPENIYKNVLTKYNDATQLHELTILLIELDPNSDEFRIVYKQFLHLAESIPTTWIA